MIKCVKCGKTWRTNNTDVKANCNTGGNCIFVNVYEEKTITSPPVLQKAKTFARAILKHFTNKAKTRTKEEIQQLYAICKSCDWFSNDTCLKCGCPVTNGSRYRNKLKWDSEHCPIGKW